MRIQSGLAVMLALAAIGCGSATGGGGASNGAGGASNGAGGASIGGAAGGSTGVDVAGGAPGSGGSAGPGSGGGSGAAGVAGTGGGPGGTAAGGASGAAGSPGSATGGSTGAGAADAGAGDGGIDASIADAPISTPAFTGSYHMGADITWVQHDEFYGATYVDVDGVQKDILDLLKNHGFNSVRLRTFVDPRATDGYDVVDGFGDLAHTIAMGQRIKKAGMGFLLSVHYSDNWADPGKQCIPMAWQQDTFAQLTQHVRDYTLNLIGSLKNAGAMPDLVQIGNEITPGMLIHLCGAGGVVISVNAVNGRATTANWPNLATLLTTGIQAVKQVDPSIKTVLHIDKGGDVGASMAWITTALAQKVPFDVFADTSYVRWQLQPSGWQNTFNMLAAAFPTLSFIIPEYANETATSPPTPSTMRIANDIIFNLPNRRGLGAWIYEPEHPVQAGVGIGLFVGVTTDAGLTDNWPVFPASSAAMSVYDQMKAVYASRL